jgi:hypothetical protein
MRHLMHLNRGGGLNRGRGRIQRSAKRAAVGSDILATADVTTIVYARKRLLEGRKLTKNDYRLARAALELIADPVGRLPGRSLIWRLKTY